LEERCARHQFEAAEDVCRTCGYDFCGECLVYAFGANKAPYCLSCALAASGVRSTATVRPVRSKREIKDRHKQWCRARSTNHHESRRVEVAPFDELVPAAPMPTEPEDNPLAWLDDQFGGTGERVPF
jgi:hypothetical protein